MKKLLILLTLIPMLATANTYTYLQGAYVQSDIDGLSETADGFELSVSRLFSDNAFFFTSYGYADLMGIDITTYDLGLGYKMPISEATDFFVTAALAGAEAEYMNSSASENGYTLSGGLKTTIDKLELEAAVNYVDLGDDSSESLFIGASYPVYQNIMLGAGYTFGDDSDTIGIAARVKF